MPTSTAGLLMRPPRTPEAYDPATLKSPTRASTAAPVEGPSPRSVRKAGRWMAMKATWKPHTKKPKQRSQKPGTEKASESTARSPITWAPGTAAAGFSESTAASGAMTIPIPASTSSVAAQPRDSMERSAPGSITNCPSDPTDMAMPMAMLRRAGGVARRMAPKTTEMVVPESPIPMRTPAEAASIVPVCAWAMRTSPAT
jgi:hypothetical protein